MWIVPTKLHILLGLFITSQVTRRDEGGIAPGGEFAPSELQFSRRMRPFDESRTNASWLVSRRLSYTYITCSYSLYFTLNFWFHSNEVVLNTGKHLFLVRSHDLFLNNLQAPHSNDQLRASDQPQLPLQLWTWLQTRPRNGCSKEFNVRSMQRD